MGNLHPLDLAILAAYLVALAGIGIYFSRRQRKLEDYLLARRGMSWLPVGLSLMAALNSGIDYLMVPSTVIKFGIVVLVVNLSWLLLYPYAFFITLPLFRRLQVYSAYEYLEHRFGLAVRGLGAAVFMLWRIGWMATALYVPCLAISSVMGRPELISVMIVILGATVTLSTMLGGIKGVIWTNVMQFCIMFSGLAGTILVAWYHVPGGVPEIATGVYAAGTTIEPASAVEPAAVAAGPLGQAWHVITGFFAVPVSAIALLISTMVGRVATYTSDQVMIQRFQTTRTVREARQGFLVTAISDVVWMTALALVGLALFAYLQHNPLPESIKDAPDRIFPYFMSQVFPVGATGLVIAAIMAASLGSIAGAINSLCAVATVDFYKRLWLGRAAQAPAESESDQRREVLVSRMFTLAVGIIGTTISCNVAKFGTIFEISNKVINSFTGPLLGIFLLGMFTRRANQPGVFCGGFIGTAVTLYTVHLSNQGTVSFLWPSTFGLAATLVVGYVSSLVFGAHRCAQEELTFQAIMRQADSSISASTLET